VTDSAASATAYLCGVKTNDGTIGVDGRVKHGNCASQQGAELTSILDWSMAQGRQLSQYGDVCITRIRINLEGQFKILTIPFKLIVKDIYNSICDI